MSNYKIINGELRRCDDELYHWKYKRKYKGSNGKWVYVYDDKQLIKSEFKVGLKEGMRALGSKISSDLDKAGDKASDWGSESL